MRFDGLGLPVTVRPVDPMGIDSHLSICLSKRFDTVRLPKVLRTE
jgi:hypothetical protein